MLNGLRRLLSWGRNLGHGQPVTAQPHVRPPLPPRPAEWNLTIDNLMDEMKAGRRGSVGWPEMEWAREYERSLLPEGVGFPRQGDLYEALCDQTVSYLTAWAAPYTGGGEALLLRGERVWIESAPADERAIGTYALPVEYDKLERRMVPEGERKNAKYGGFYFYLSTRDLNDKFRLVGTGYSRRRGEEENGPSRRLSE
ncbi:MAG: hypothetical protein QG662_2091 [Pseudomonadota bacterium]|nr:hypothetical protein [Pseudomonadota bacterium]